MVTQNRWQYQSWIHLTMLLFAFSTSATAASVGKVVIGTPGAESTSLSYSNNDLQTDRWYFNVYIQVTNSSADLVNLANNVTISCELTPGWSGYSSAVFKPLTVEAPNASAPNFTVGPSIGQIQFSNLKPGRPAVLRCWGESVLEVIYLGENDTRNATTPQFTKEGSISPPVTFTIYRQGTVNICDERIIVPYSENQKESTSKFLIELSDPVETNTSVIVTCTVSPENATNSNDALGIDIEYPIEVQENENKVEVTYSRTKGTATVLVTCYGQSIFLVGNDTINGTQYVPDKSKGEAIPFVLDQGYVIIEPGVTPLRDSKMKLFVVLDAVVLTDVTFTCRAETVQTSEEAVYIADNPYCQDIADVLVERPYTNITNGGVDVDVNATSRYETTAAVFTSDLDDNSNMTTAELTTEPQTSTPTTTTELPCYVIQQTEVQEVTIIPTLVNGTLVNVTRQFTRVINQTVAVNCSHLYTASTPATTAAPRNVTGEWLVREPKIIFQSGKDRFKELTIERMSVPRGAVQELVVVTCCAPDQTVNPKYRGKSAASLIVSALTPNITVNLTAATLPGNEDKETSIKNPAYVELSPCPCDITMDSCDVDCCCDNDCSASDKKTFTCIPGVAGGFPAPMPGYSCGWHGVGQEDWFPLLCVHKQNSAFLGYFFDNVLGIRTEVDFKRKAQSVRPAYTYKETEVHTQFQTGRPYRHGSEINTGQVAQQLEDNIIPNKNFLLGLPQKSLQGDCVTTSPVRYLVDVDNECTQTVMQDMCTALSPLSALVYAQSTSISVPPCPRAPVIIRKGGTEKVASVNSNYLCTSQTDPYLRSTLTQTDLYKPTQDALFAHEVDTDNCDFDTDTQAFRCSQNKTEETAYTPPRCVWDDGYTPPPAPVYNATTKICHHAVLDVHYNFTWRGREILLLNATYVLGDLPMELVHVDNYSYDYVSAPVVSHQQPPHADTTTTAPVPDLTTAQSTGNSTIDLPLQVESGDTLRDSNISVTTTIKPAVLGQKFKVIFWPEYKVKNVSSNDTSRTDRYSRSGKVGYENDMPVLSGVPVWDASGTALAYMNTADNVRLSVWAPAHGGLCAGSTQQVVDFRQDALSSCTLRIGLSQLYSGCDNLRRQILHNQDALMPASFISRNGDPDTTSLDHWITILRQNITSIIPLENIPITTESMTTEDATTQASESTSTDIPYEITTANVTENDTISGPSIDTDTIGRCPNIPSGIHVDIMYAVAGAVNSRPILEIVGAKISYTLSTWSLVCSGATGAACLGNASQMAADNNGEEAVQSFALTSSVNFHLVPPKDEPPITRYEEMRTHRVPFCHGDACWEELFYPFTASFQGDPLQYVRAVSLTCLIFLLAYLFVTWPWW